MIRQGRTDDLPAIARLAAELWPHHTPAELEAEFLPLMIRPDAAFFLCETAGGAVGFAQCQLRRDYVEGTDSSPVGYLEGIYVRPGCRRQGNARALLSACEAWAGNLGCTEFASDCELENEESRAFHLHVGFSEANRIVCLTKKLAAPAFPPYAGELVQRALAMGAAGCVPFRLSDICFDSRTLLKCMFGCADWGKGLTCPSRPGSPSMAEYREMLSRYRWGVIIGGHDKHITQKVSFALEGRAFGDGYYFAFSLSDCGLCRECAGHTGGECRHVREARPAFHSVGIDVFKTVRRLGLPISTLTDPANQEQNWYAAVFVE